MNDHAIRVLLVDDDEDDYVVTRAVLSEIDGQRFDLEWVATYDSAMEAIGPDQYDVCLVDYYLGARNGLELIREAQENGCRSPMILLTGLGDRAVDMEAMEAGAADYLVKGQLDPLLLERSIRYSIQRRRAEETRIKLEEELRQFQKMETIGRLAGGVAHEFNNLLTPIMGYATLLMNKLTPEDSMNIGLGEILKASERASSLTHQLLTFSRRQIIEPKVFSLNDLIVNLSLMLRRLISEDIELITLPASEVKPIKADPSQIEQVLINLTVNARDAMPNGGKLTIETANIPWNQDWIDQYPKITPGEYVMLAVSDNGTGMMEEVKAHIFEPFFTTKEVGQGTGLGLATCYGIVNQIGGHIEVYSELGQGTSFKIYLPSVDQPVWVPSQPEVREDLPRGAETILLAEDEPMVRAMIATILREQGYVVLEAANGDEALRMAQQHAGEEIHLLLTDVVMPQMGGVELCDKFNSIRPNTPVLLASGYTDEVITERGLLNNGAAFLQKPFTPAVLANKVRELLDGPIPIPD